MEKIIVSACLMGLCTRYDGKANSNDEILDLAKSFDLIPVCPEIYGGLATPRLPSEIRGSKVVNAQGDDVTDNFNKGAQDTLKICQILGATRAILKSKSPSCGSGLVYDGTFTGHLVPGDGITARLLKAHGIKVYGEDDLGSLLV